jgi:hypothetical protein
VPDHWAWVEEEPEALVERGLFAWQTRPPLGSNHPRIDLLTFTTAETTISDAFFVNQMGQEFPITGFATNVPAHTDGIGNWAFNKDYLLWFYEPTFGTEEVYVAVVDTSPPVPAYPGPLAYSEDLFYFPVTANGYYEPRILRSVPPDSSEISFLARPDSMTSARHLVTISYTGSPAVVDEITAADLHGGGVTITYYAWSPDGRWLAAQVDGRLVIYDRLGASIALDVAESYSTSAYQFSSNSLLLHYVLGGQLFIRTAATGWSIDSVVNEDAYTWDVARKSPDGLYWTNSLGVADGSIIRFKDATFFNLSEVSFGHLGTGSPAGDFSNDSRWFVEAEDNLNENSIVYVGPDAGWTDFDAGSTQIANVQMQSFQAF